MTSMLYGNLFYLDFAWKCSNRWELTGWRIAWVMGKKNDVVWGAQEETTFTRMLSVTRRHNSLLQTTFGTCVTDKPCMPYWQWLLWIRISWCALNYAVLSYRSIKLCESCVSILSPHYRYTGCVRHFKVRQFLAMTCLWGIQSIDRIPPMPCPQRVKLGKHQLSW